MFIQYIAKLRCVPLYKGLDSLAMTLRELLLHEVPNKYEIAISLLMRGEIKTFH